MKERGKAAWPRSWSSSRLYRFATSGSVPQTSARRPTLFIAVLPPRPTYCRPSKRLTTPITTGWEIGLRSAASIFTRRPPTLLNQDLRHVIPRTPRGRSPHAPRRVALRRVATSWPSTGYGVTCVTSVVTWGPQPSVECVGPSTLTICGCVSGTICTANSARSPRNCTWRSTAPQPQSTGFLSPYSRDCCLTSGWSRSGSRPNGTASAPGLRNTSVLAARSSPLIPDRCWHVSRPNSSWLLSWWRPLGCGPGQLPRFSPSGWRRSRALSSSVPGRLRIGQHQRRQWSLLSVAPSLGCRYGLIVASLMAASIRWRPDRFLSVRLS